jgi:hypothetical protein
MKNEISILAKYLAKEDLTMFETAILKHLLKREDLLKELWEKSKEETSKYGTDLEVYFNDYVGKYVFDYMREHTKGKESTELVEHALLDVRFWKLNDILIKEFNLKGGKNE